MPAPNCGTSPDDSESNMNLSEEDGEDLPSKTSPATHHLTLKRGHVRETTAPPRTNKKPSDSVEEGNIFDRAPSSPPKDSTSDPPVKKAKLLNASSASCGEVLSQKVNSKGSLKRAASTDSEDEMSCDGSKTDIFRERDDGDKARCIRQYSNRVKAKRKAEELPSAPQERDQDSSAGPPGAIQMDHDYGRASDAASAQSLDDGNLDQKEKNNPFVNQESSVHSTQSESTETSASAAESSETSTQLQCALDTNQYNPSSVGEEAPASHRESSASTAFPQNDCVASAAATDDEDGVAESAKSQKDNEKQLLLSGTPNFITTDSNPGCGEQPQAGGGAASGHPGQTRVCSGAQDQDATKCSAGRSEGTTTSSVGHLGSQADHGVKEELKSRPLQHQDAPDTTTGCESEKKIVYSPEEGESKDICSSSAPVLAGPGSVVDVMDERTDSTPEDVEADGELDSARELQADADSQPDSAQEEDLQIHSSYEGPGHAAEGTEEADHGRASTPGTHMTVGVKPLETPGQGVSNGAPTEETEITTGSDQPSGMNSTVEHPVSANLENSSGQKSHVTAVTECFIPECTLEGHNGEERHEPDGDACAADLPMATEHFETRTEAMPESSAPDASGYPTERCDEATNLPVVCLSSEDRGPAEADMQTGSDDTSDAAAMSETQELAEPPQVQTLEDHRRSDSPTECGSPIQIQPEVGFQTVVASVELCSPTEVSEVAVQEEFTAPTQGCEGDEDARTAACESSTGIQDKDQVEANPEGISATQTHRSTEINFQQDQEEDIDGAVTAGEVQTSPMKTEPEATVNLRGCENLVNNLDMESRGEVTGECCEGKDPQLQMDTDTSSAEGPSVPPSTAEVRGHQSHDVTNLDTEVQENPANESFEMNHTTANTADCLGTLGTATEEEGTSSQQSTVNAHSCERDLSTDVQQDPLSRGEESKTDEDKLTGEECDSVIETHVETAAAESVSDSSRMEDKNHESTKISEADAGLYRDLESRGDEDEQQAEPADVPEVMVSKPEESSSLSVELQSCRSMEGTEIHQEEEETVRQSYGAEVDENVLAAAYISIPEPQMSTDDLETPEEIMTTVDGEDHRGLETSEGNESLQNDAAMESGKMDADDVTTDCMNVPEVQTSAPPEETPNPSLAEIQSCGQVEMLELEKDVKEDQAECKVKENPSTTQHVDDPEPGTNMEATTSPEEIPYPPPAIESETVEITGGGSDVRETTDHRTAGSVVPPECKDMDTTSTEPVQSDVESSQLSMSLTADLLPGSWDGKAEEEAFAAEHPGPQRKAVGTAATEEVLSPPSALETVGEASERSTEVQNNAVSGSSETTLDEVSCTAEGDEVPEAPEAPEETTAAQEQRSSVTSAVEQECQETICEPPNAPLFHLNNPPAVAASQYKENESGGEDIQVDVDATCGSREEFDSALEEEDKMQVTQADEAPVIISTDQPDAEHKEGTEHREVMLLVVASGEAVPISEVQVQVIAQPQAEIQADQVVYEPISSPESSDDREVPAAPHNHVGFSVLGMEETVVGASSAEGNTTVSIQVENDAQRQSQVPDSQEEETRGERSDVADRCASPAAEQSVHVKQVAVISSSDDIRMHEGQPEGAVEGGENSRCPDGSASAESSEVVPDISGHQEGTDGTMMATAATTMFALPDSTSEEYVILEPVPQSQIHFDIVTQAAAESGLSVPFAAQVNPGVALEGGVINGPQVMVFSQGEVPQAQASGAAEALNRKSISPVECVVQNSDHQQQPSSKTMDADASEIDLTNSNTQKTSQDSVAMAMDTNEENLELQEVQILEDMEIGREVVLAEEDNEEDGDVSIVEKPQEKEAIPPEKSEEEPQEKNKEDSSESKFKPNSTAEGDKKEPEDVKPKKQQMNTQARTKARLAALAEQKAAAARKSANRHQLNLLALCQEIAEDIETDSMLLKKIEEEKQAAAAAVADVASKNEASEESPHANTPANAPTAHASAPVDPEASVTPTKEESPTQLSAADAAEAKAAEANAAEAKPAEAKPAEEPPKRRFFISQVTVPLKAHEKKKLTRYQRLRQVELQREKMSWARVKKLKSDQANQMFSDIDWQEPLNVFSQFSMNPIAKAPPPGASPAKTPLPSVASTSKSEGPNQDVPIAETPKDEPMKTEPVKTEPVKTEPNKTEPVTAETIKTEPAEPEEAKSTPVKTETVKSIPPPPEVRRSTRQAKAQASKETPSPVPAQKVTRSAAKKKLPAVPPPMPNGLSAQKQTPVEYKPYRPKPKYSFEDFELDDDPVPVATARPSPCPQPQQTRASVQPFPRAQAKPVLPAAPANQAILKTRLDSSPSISAGAAKPTSDTPATAAGSSKAALSAKAPVKPSALSTPQSTPVPAPAQAGPAACPLVKASSSGDAAPSGQSTSPTSSSSAAAAVGPAPEKSPSPPSAESSSKVTRL